MYQIATFPVTCPYCGQELDGVHQGSKLFVPEHKNPETEETCEGSGQEAA